MLRSGLSRRVPEVIDAEIIDAPLETQVEVTIQSAIYSAIAKAIEAQSDDSRIVVVNIQNVNIQIAEGGGATNQIGNQASANNRWDR